MTFKTNPFKKWMHHIAGVAIKTRDNFTCQWQASPNCLGGMVPLEAGCHPHHVVSRDNNIVAWDPLNLICLCSKCHALAEKQSLLFNMWYIKRYPNRAEHVHKKMLLPPKTWYQSDFEQEEKDLFEYCIDMNVDYLSVNTKHRARYKRRIEQILFERKE